MGMGRVVGTGVGEGGGEVGMGSEGNVKKNRKIRDLKTVYNNVPQNAATLGLKI